MAPWLRWEAAMVQKQYDAMQAGRYAATARQLNNSAKLYADDQVGLGARRLAIIDVAAGQQHP